MSDEEQRKIQEEKNDIDEEIRQATVKEIFFILYGVRFIIFYTCIV